MCIKFAGHTMGTPGHDVFQAIALVANAGLDGIEFRVASDGVIDDLDFTAEFGGKILGHARQAGLEICAVDSYYQDFLGERDEALAGMKRTVDLAAALQCPVVRIKAGRGVPEGPALEVARDQVADALRELGDYAHARGVVGGIETHSGTLCHTAAETRDLLDRIEHPAIKVIFDYAFIYQANQESLDESIELLGPDIVHVHAKDYVGCSADHTLGENCVLGEGDLGWDRVIGKLVEIGYRGYLSDEYEKYWKPSLPDPAVWFRKTAAAMRKMVAAAR